MLCAMTATLAILAAGTGSRAAARQQEQKVQPQGGYGMTTGLVGIVQGQTARLTVWNKGDQAALTRLQFVDEQGKVLFLCDIVIPAGKAEAVNAYHPGGVNRLEFQAQFGTNEKRTIGLLVPTLQVIDNATGANSWMIGQEGFTEIRPIFIPPLTAPW
jgi:hypothetical protein